MAQDSPQTDKSQDLQTAYLILLGGGLVGGVLVLASIVTAWWWWEPLLNWLRDGTRDKFWQPILAVAGLLVGLAIMFAAFQAARKFERIDVTLRRVLYGFNAFLTGFLVLLLLVVINVFVQIRYPLPFDTTEGGFYSLGEKTRQWTAALEQPVEVYMLLDPSSDPAAANMKTLLTQMRSINGRYFQFEEVPIDGTNNSRIRDLMKRFTGFVPREGGGVLVAFGEKPEANYTFIASSELTNVDFAGGGAAPQRSFNGEMRLMQELMFLGEDKRRPIIYVTQGHGEPEMSDRGPEGLAEFVQRLMKANYDVRPLTSTNPEPAKNVVPADADVVLIIGPRRAMLDIVPGLRTYLFPTDEKAKKGKLVVMLGPTGADRARAGKMVETGLEPLLADLGLVATGEQILTMQGPGGRLMARGNQPFPEAVFVGAPRGSTESRHPVAQLVKDELHTWTDVRRLEIPPAAPNARFNAETLMTSTGFVWLESDMTKPSLETWTRFRADQELLRQRVQQEPQPVLLAISETKGSDDPHASMKPNQGRTPRLMVFGCSSIAGNEYQRPRAGGIEFDLIRGSIDWCRERFSNIGVEPKNYRYFVLPKDTSYWNLFYLPLAAMGLTVLGLGVIVWNVRRT